MSVKSRILAIQLYERLQKDSDYAKKIGVSVKFSDTKDLPLQDKNHTKK